MKRCPVCQSIYTDESLTYCLQDGAKLTDVRDSASSEDDAWQMSGGRELPRTEILNPDDMPTVRIEPGAATREHQRARPTALNAPVSPQNSVNTGAPKSNAPVIALSAAVAVLLLALGGLITWIVMRNKGETRTASNTGSSQSATPQPSAVDAAAAQKEVQAALDAWADTIRQRNLEEHMKYYAKVLDIYYNATNVSQDRVRADRSEAFSKYNSMSMQIANVDISIDPSGVRAIATFDKTFDFRGAEKDFSGSGLNRFWLAKAGGRWRITGEKDLKTYYINK